MHTPSRVFAQSIGLAARSALPLLGVLALAGQSFAQAPPPSPFGPPPTGAPGALPPGAAPPAAGAPGGATSPFGQPPGGMAPLPGGPGAMGAPGTVDFNATGPAAGPAPGAQPAPEQPVGALSEDEERALSLMEQPNLVGSTGLLHTSYAGSSSAGMFRLGFLTDWLKASSFLCNPSNMLVGGRYTVCKNGQGPTSLHASDDASRVGGTFFLNATPFSFLEAYAMLRTYATSDTNDQGVSPAANEPTLLQVLGDTTLGVKAFYPPKLGRIFTFGGEVQLLLMNGTGGVGVSGSGTSALFRLLGTADFRNASGGGVPIRINLNLGYKLDNSGQLVQDVEQQRATNAHLPAAEGVMPISRIERFGLGINQVDTVQTYLGVEVPLSKVQPYVEWSADIPANRQGWQCHTATIQPGDACLGLENINAANPQNAGGPGFKAIPSRLRSACAPIPCPICGVGCRRMPRSTSATSGSQTFVEELAPQAPWTLYLGLGFAYDMKMKAPPPAPPAAPQIQTVPAPQTLRARAGA